MTYKHINNNKTQKDFFCNWLGLMRTFWPKIGPAELPEVIEETYHAPSLHCAWLAWLALRLGHSTWISTSVYLPVCCKRRRPGRGTGEQCADAPGSLPGCLDVQHSSALPEVSTNEHTPSLGGARFAVLPKASNLRLRGFVCVRVCVF